MTATVGSVFHLYLFIVSKGSLIAAVICAVVNSFTSYLGKPILFPDLASIAVCICTVACSIELCIVKSSHPRRSGCSSCKTAAVS